MTLGAPRGAVSIARERRVNEALPHPTALPRDTHTVGSGGAAYDNCYRAWASLSQTCSPRATSLRIANRATSQGVIERLRSLFLKTGVHVGSTRRPQTWRSGDAYDCDLCDFRHSATPDLGGKHTCRA